MRDNGFEVEVHNTQNLQSIKEKAGLKPGMGSCHTAFIDGYAIEGHVPAEDVRRLLEQRPDAHGLTVPGMPVGSRAWKWVTVATPTRSSSTATRACGCSPHTISKGLRGGPCSWRDESDGQLVVVRLSRNSTRASRPVWSSPLSRLPGK